MTVEVVAAATTRPGDTTTYAAGEVFDAATGAGLVFTDVVRKPGDKGTIVGLSVLDSANQTLKPSLELWLFNAVIGYDNDNAAFTPTDAELATLVAIIPLVNAYVGDATSGAGGNAVYTPGSTLIPFETATTSRNLYGVIVVRNAYVPVASEILTVNLRVLQD